MIRTLDDEIINALCEAGGIRFNLAIESGNDFIRNKLLRKNCSREKIFDTVGALRRHHVLVNAFFMIGFPEDTEETLGDTLTMIEELDIDALTLSKVTPLPGTALFAQCFHDDLFTSAIDVDSMWNGEHPIVKSLVDGGGGGGFFIKPYNLTMDKLLEHNDKINAVIKKKMVRTALRQIRKKQGAKP
jgi:magnesium-protoporphyrin IX monomethyl ester (oxidative) cyclase